MTVRSDIQLKWWHLILAILSAILIPIISGILTFSTSMTEIRDASATHGQKILEHDQEIRQINENLVFDRGTAQEIKINLKHLMLKQGLQYQEVVINP